MPNNPFVKPAPAEKRIMPPRTALVPGAGVPTGEALNNWMPEELVDGAMCYVLSEGSIFIFDKFSMAAETASIIATCKGIDVPGRWIEYSVISTAKAYRCISYASPNDDGNPTTAVAIPQNPQTWTPFQAETHAASLGGFGNLTFDGVHSIVAGADMVAKIEWHMSYYIGGGALDYYVGCIINNLNEVNGAITRTYYGTGADHRNVVIGASTITNIATNDSFQLMVSILGPVTDASFVMNYGTLVITEL